MKMLMSKIFDLVVTKDQPPTSHTISFPEKAT